MGPCKEAKQQDVHVWQQDAVDLKETKHLYGRLMGLARSNRDIDQKQAVGTYEFTLTPRALSSPNGSVLPCNDKSKLIHVLEKLTTRETTEADQQSNEDPIETDADLSVCFNDRLMNLTRSNILRSSPSLTHTRLIL